MPKKKAAYEFLPIYDISIFYGNDAGEIISLIGEYFKDGQVDFSLIEECKECSGFVAPISKTGCPGIAFGYAMCIRESNDLATLAHEATHLTNFIFSSVGQELDVVNDESQAYLTGYLAQSFAEKIEGKKSKFKPLTKLKNRSKTK